MQDTNPCACSSAETHSSAYPCAAGEAPDGIRNCFQQRSRWTKGHFQIIMNRKYCPLTRRRLDWLSRLLYCRCGTLIETHIM